MALDYVAGKCGVDIIREKYKALTAVTEMGGEKVLLMKPLTYMNLSGDAIGEAASFFKVPASRVLVLCDDITLPAGTLRLRNKGSAGGHNGLKSIISGLGGDGFSRIKIGVGNNTPSGEELVGFVLGKPNPDDRAAIERRLPDIYESVKLIISGKFAEAQNRYNGAAK